MRKKNIKIKSKILLFFKLFPFLYNEDEQELIKNIIVAYSSTEDIEVDKNLFIYYLLYKNLYRNEAINYFNLTDNKFKIRTNNKVKNFHLLLNNNIIHNHPKLLSLLKNIKF